MRKIAVVLLVAFFVFGGMPEPWFPLDAFAQSGFVPGSAVRTTQKVTAWWGPGLSWSVRYTIFEGQLVTVCGPHPDYGANTVNGFVRVMYEGRISWVPAKYLTIERVGYATGRTWDDYYRARRFRWRYLRYRQGW